jgi:hypothetical protein
MRELVKIIGLNRRLLFFIGLALSMITLTVMAIPPNWFEAAEVTGVVVETGTTTVKAIINLGDLSSATSFSASGDGTITIEESGGLSIEKFIMGYPYYTTEEEYVYERYLTNRFHDLTLDLTVGDTTVSMPIVVDGEIYYWYWEYDDWETQWSYRSYPDWTSITLSQGTHTVTFTIYGTTALTTQTLSVEMMFYFELAAP